MKLEEEIILSIINNIGLGAIVGLGAFMLNVVLEKYKSTRTIIEETTKLRINKISEIWDKLEEIHIALIQISLEIIEIKRKDKTETGELDTLSKEATQHIDKKISNKLLPIIQDKIPDVRYMIRAYSFWIGKKLIDILINQLNALSRLAEAIPGDLAKGEVDFKSKQLNQAIDLVESTKKDIQEIVNLLK